MYVLDASEITSKVSLTSRVSANRSLVGVVSSNDPFAAQQHVNHISLRYTVWSDISIFLFFPRFDSEIRDRS